MTAACLFCRVARGEAPAARVLDTKTVMAFLDHRPLFPGHCLVIPRAHVETLGDLPGPLTAPLFEAAAAVARALEAGLGADGTFVAINNRVSQSVAHLHVHVVPRRRGDGLRGFFWPRGRYESAAAMEETRERIAGALDAGA
ncbi:MAG TPA: HIT family protein [Methylomirabilota bacterium]|jgi:histidine triad (HIT) family protein|nr:HIT family protein [Methylomirabilota bacterium]